MSINDDDDSKFYNKINVHITNTVYKMPDSDDDSDRTISFKFGNKYKPKKKYKAKKKIEKNEMENTPDKILTNQYNIYYGLS